MHDQQPATEFDPGDENFPHVEDIALAAIPSGAFALAGGAVGLLVIAWLAIYFFVFLTRGPVS